MAEQVKLPFLEIDDDTIAVNVPENTMWVEVLPNTYGKFINTILDIKSSCFLRYGPKENTFYYNPKTFYLPKGKWKFEKIENNFIILKRDND